MDQATDIYAKAAAELASIDKQIAALEQRRIALRQFVELGRKLYSPPNSLPESAHSEIALSNMLMYPNGPALVRASRERTMKARILALCEEAILAKGPTHTRDLVTYIEDHGVEVTGADKNTTVSVVLSRSDEFRSDRIHGWSLVKKNPQDVAASAGSSTA